MSEKVIISESKCIGCGLCASDCPSQVIEMEQGKAVVKSDQCLKCGHCIAICPKNAVEISDLDMGEVKSYEELAPQIESDQLLDYYKSLRTIRKFKKKAVEDELIHGIIEAGRYTATGTNRQQVRYIVVKEDIELLESLVLPKLRTLQHVMKYLGKVLKPKYDFSRYNFQKGFLFKNAPSLILVVSEHEMDAALAARSMELMSRTYGLGGLYVGIFTTFANRSRKIRRLLGLEGKEKVVACLALGYPDIKYRRTTPKRKAVVEWR
jgi:nitroreductase/NAD-dependent dihydropyrimidine dehydrogenase PreA subunit